MTGHSYHWTITGTGASIVNGQGTHQITVDWGPSSGTLTVTETDNITGCDSTTAPYLVDVSDNSPPVIVSCPGDTATDSDAGICGAAVTVPALIATDDCGIASIVNDYNGTSDASDTYPVGTTTVTWTVTDVNGNTSTCQTIITVTDNEPPTAICKDITINLDENTGQASINSDDIDGGSTDNCGIVNRMISKSAFDCSDIGDNPDTLIVVDAAGYGDTCIATVTVEYATDPDPTVNPPIDTICNGTSWSFTMDNSFTNIQFSWTVTAHPDISGYNNGSYDGTGGLPHTINQTLVNAGDIARFAVYKFVPKIYNQCELDTIYDTVWVEPVPVVVATPMKDTICHNTQTDILLTTPTSSTSGVEFTYTSTASDGSIGGNGTGTLLPGQRIQETLTNGDDTYGWVEYVITPWTLDASGNRKCVGTQIHDTVWVEPVPVVSLTPVTDTICDNGKTNILISSPTHPIYPVRFRYLALPEYPDSVNCNITEVIGLFNGGRIQEQIDNLSDRPQKVTYRVIAYTVNGFGFEKCTGDTSYAVVWVNPTPRVLLIPKTSRICNHNFTDVVLTTPTQVTRGVVTFDLFSIVSGNPGDVTGYTSSLTDIASGYSIRDTLVNNTDTVQSVRYVIKPRALGLTYLGCVDGIVDTVTVLLNPDPLQQIVLVKDNTCYGIDEAILDLDVGKGTEPLSYAWTGPAHFTSDQKRLEDLRGGIYTATVTDNFGCHKTGQIHVNYPAPIMLAADAIRNISGNNITCNGGSDGTIYFFISDVGAINPPFYYWVRDESGTVIASGNMNPGYAGIKWLYNLSAGTYSIEIEDAVGCHTGDFVELKEPDSIKIFMHSPVYVDPYNISCKESHDGRIRMDSVTGGNGWFKYNWAPGADVRPGGILIPESPEQDSLTAGTYYLHITDTLGCFANDSITLLEPDGIELTDTILSLSADGNYNISCFGGHDGSIGLRVAGGSGEYSYYWTTSDGSGLDPAERDQDGLTAGTYHVRISDESSCYIEREFTLTEPAPLQITDSVSLANDGIHNVSCAGSNDGLIDITVSGGSVGNYTYLWTTANGSGLIPEAEDQSGLTAGDYQVTVTDMNGCVIDTTITLTRPDPIKIEFTPTHISCDPGYDDGAIQATVTGGTGAGTYDYLWSTGETATDHISDLTAGWYSLQITDINGCVMIDSIEILLPPPLKLELNISDFHGSNIACNGDANGSIEVSILSGTPAYQYVWTGPDGFSSTDSSIYQLKAGDYTLHVEDAKHCLGDTTVRMKEPDPLMVNITKSSSLSGDYNINCYGENTGSIELDPVGGTPAYSYLWDDGNTKPDLADLPAGIYHVEVSDMNGCITDTTVQLTQPDSLTLILAVKNTYCPDMSDGQVVAYVNGGVEPYNYFWSTGEGGDRIENIIPGEYSVTVTDANMCMVGDTVKVKSDRPQCLEIPNAFSPNGDGVNDIWEIGKTELYPDMVVQIYNRWGELIFRSNPGYSNPWDGTYHGKTLPMDSYYYVIDPGNGAKPIKGNVTIVR